MPQKKPTSPPFTKGHTCPVCKGKHAYAVYLYHDCALRGKWRGTPPSMGPNEFSNPKVCRSCGQHHFQFLVYCPGCMSHRMSPMEKVRFEGKDFPVGLRDKSMLPYQVPIEAVRALGLPKGTFNPMAVPNRRRPFPAAPDTLDAKTKAASRDAE